MSQLLRMWPIAVVVELNAHGMAMWLRISSELRGTCYGVCELSVPGKILQKKEGGFNSMKYNTKRKANLASQYLKKHAVEKARVVVPYG